MRRLVSIGIILLLSLPIAFVPFYSKTASATFSSTTNLSSDAGASEEPEIAASGANVYAVWTDDTAGNYEIFFAASTNSGASFGITHNLSSNGGASTFPQMAVSGTNVYIVWNDNTGNSSNFEIFFVSSTNGGAMFSGSVNLSNNSGGS